MEDAAKWKNKVDLVLDSRQIFLLLFGGASVACLVFVLGIMAGKRLESKNNLSISSCGAELEVLDQMVEKDPDLTFQRVLVKKGTNPNLPPEVFETAEFGEPLPATPSSDTSQSKRVQNTETNPRARPFTPGAASTSAENTENKSAADASENSKTEKRAAQKRFTLQVSSFKERTQAEAMVRRLETKGLKPYMISSHIPQRGMWYRVRLGAFASWDDAVGAKEEFEKNWRMTAYVMRRN